jgi:pyrroline-5-carboxylate reductase
MTHRLLIVGGGNMGAALIGGLLVAGWQAEEIAVVEVLADRRDELAGRFPGVHVGGEVVAAAAAVVAVKPTDVPGAVAAAAAVGCAPILSIAAGVSLTVLQTAAGDGRAVVRAMPNTAALVGRGAAAIAGGSAAGDADLAWAEDVLGAVGTVVRVSEGQLDAVTGLSGSGPAYLFLVAEALIDAGVLVGLPRATAESLVRQLFTGSAALLDQPDADPAVLRAMVTSPGGTTAAGLRVLEEHGVRSAMLEAVVAAAARSTALGNPAEKVT